MNNKVSYPELFFLFFTGSILGFFLEGIWRVIRTGAWENHSATVYGPFCIIYGFGAAALYWITGDVNGMPLWQQFLRFAIAGAAVEYTGSFLQEHLLGSVSWDYTGRFLSLNGRVCFSMTLMWGMLGILYSRLFAPAADHFFDIAAHWPYKGICAVLSIAMAADLMLSAAALYRWRERQDDIPPQNIIEERLDEHYDDERMEEIYNNMVFQDHKKQPAVILKAK